MTNREIAAILFNIATILADRQGNPYRIRAYRRAARNILRVPHSLVQRARAGAPLGVPLLGASLTAKITALAKDDPLPFYEELCAGLPLGERALLRVPGFGPVLARRIARVLGELTPAGLSAAASSGKLRGIWGVGPQREQTLLRAYGSPAPATQLALALE
jgi:DNA polymerase (family 10)